MFGHIHLFIIFVYMRLKVPNKSFIKVCTLFAFNMYMLPKILAVASKSWIELMLDLYVLLLIWRYPGDTSSICTCSLISWCVVTHTTDCRDQNYRISWRWQYSDGTELSSQWLHSLLTHCCAHRIIMCYVQL